MYYYEVCPRGFGNEKTFIKVDESQVDHVNRYFKNFKDNMFNAGEPGAYSGWTNKEIAKVPGVAMTWKQYLAMMRI